jgi:predicted lipoprotein with Yx(FWY)xxD motif
MSLRTTHVKANTLRLAVAVPLAAVGLAACGSSSSGGNAGVSSGGASSPASSGSSGSSSPATSFSAANVAGLGKVVVDARGRTVYVLTAPGKKNVPCTDASGCTSVWPDLPLPSGTSAAKAGSGLKSSLLGAKKLSDGETYPTYNGYLMYEYASDSGPGQANGQGIKSFGGTWWALSPSGKPITSSASTSSGASSSSSSSGSGGGYSY